MAEMRGLVRAGAEGSRGDRVQLVVGVMGVQEWCGFLGKVNN